MGDMRLGRNLLGDVPEPIEPQLHHLIPIAGSPILHIAHSQARRHPPSLFCSTYIATGAVQLLWVI
jgi:hypothetical protein